MTLLEIRSRVGPDGMLALAVPVGTENANREVSITINTLEKGAAAKSMTRQEWEQLMDRIGGAIDDPTFVRHEQGHFEDRGENWS